VVFEKGDMQKAHYRRYRIKTVKQQDDYAYLAEILQRRFGKGVASQPLPDLLMVDGGKGQLNMALAILRNLALDEVIDVVGIAKPDKGRGELEDKIYKPGQANPVVWGRDHDLLLFLQRIRDEAHRFAIAFQRQRRGKRSLHSVLDAIPGVGPKRKAVLLEHLGSVQKIRAADVAALSRLPGFNRNLAEAIVQHFGKMETSAGSDRRR
jgi:excinuclease ABC subunit C